MADNPRRPLLTLSCASPRTRSRKRSAAEERPLQASRPTGWPVNAERWRPSFEALPSKRRSSHALMVTRSSMPPCSKTRSRRHGRHQICFRAIAAPGSLPLIAPATLLRSCPTSSPPMRGLSAGRSWRKTRLIFRAWNLCGSSRTATPSVRALSTKHGRQRLKPTTGALSSSGLCPCATGTPLNIFFRRSPPCATA
jgi:hypothetical protein